MKKLFILSALSLLLMQCSDLFNKLEEKEQLYPVRFIAQMKFGQVETPLKSGDINSDSITSSNDSVFYRYLVYKSNGTPHKQTKGEGSIIDDQLPMGSYFAAI